METNFFEYENKCRENGYKLIAGVDEAGRGPLAGAVYAAAVIVYENPRIVRGFDKAFSYKSWK